MRHGIQKMVAAWVDGQTSKWMNRQGGVCIHGSVSRCLVNRRLAGWMNRGCGGGCTHEESSVGDWIVEHVDKQVNWLKEQISWCTGNVRMTEQLAISYFYIRGPLAVH